MAERKSDVGFNWRELFTWKKILITVTLIVLVSFFSYHYGFIKKSCYTADCFSNSVQKCSPTKYLKLQNLNYYKYSIKGRRGDMCLLEIELKKMAEGTALDKRILFEGKGMTCRVPMDEVSSIQSDNIEGILNYCTGPLKEAMYELIIQKLYTIIIANLGDVIGEIQSTLYSEV